MRDGELVTSGVRPRTANSVGEVRVGLSGWSYRHWRNRFYPAGLPASEELAFVASSFNTVEINRTFYSLVKPAWFRRLRDQTPSDFQFAVKGSRFITHMKKLSGVEVALANFFASGLVELGEKLGPILWQLPAGFPADLERIEGFLRLLPRSHQAITEIAAFHTRDGIEVGVPQSEAPVRHVLEIRDSSFPAEELRELATKAEVCLAATHSSRWPYMEEETTDFMYFRLHGPGALYGSSYSDQQLQGWADRLAGWKASRSTTGAPFDVYVYFDNDGYGHAPRNALHLQGLLEAKG